MAFEPFPLKTRHFRLGGVLLKNYLNRKQVFNPDGKAGPPVQVHLQPTLACNLHCKMCIQNGSAGYLKGGNSLVKARLPLKVYEKLLQDCAGHGPFVHVWGGEPLLYKEIDGLIDVIRRLNLPVMMTTNSVRGLDHIDAIMKLDVLRLSVDGPADVHDNIRGRPGTFQNFLDLVHVVDDQKKRRHSFWPRIVTNTLLIDESYRRLPEIADILYHLPIDRSDLSLPMFTTAERGRAYEAILKKEWDSPAKSWKGFMIEGLTVDLDELTRLVTDVLHKYPRNRFNLFPIGHISGIPDYYHKLDHVFGFDRCHAVTDNFNVLPNGDVVLCNDLPDFVIGNITEQSFPEIWNGERARSFRIRLAKALLPVCSRCCLLYTFPIVKAAWQQRWLR